MPVSKAQQKAVSKYMKENYDEIKIRIPKAKRRKFRLTPKHKIRVLMLSYGKQYRK